MTAARQPERRHPRGPAAQAAAKTAGIPVVVLSADVRPGPIQRLLEQGARAFLTKPLDVKELLELLDAVAAERQEAIAAG
jgi:CheY-like chemotaxis protein